MGWGDVLLSLGKQWRYGICGCIVVNKYVYIETVESNIQCPMHIQWKTRTEGVNAIHYID
jgi:hypothetical protein